jgi:putative nucleotidyltransferase with HDIG domain/PAS domain S-box-containing protein
MKPEKLTILIIEDNPADARLIKEALVEDIGVAYNLKYADSLSNGLKNISEKGFDIVLLDLSLPDSIGLETISGISKKNKDVPLIILTGTDDLDIATRALKIGAQDYLVKGHFDSASLSRSIRYAIERKKIEIDRKLFEETLVQTSKEWRVTFDAIEEAISVTDLEGRIIRANRTMSIMVNKDFKEILKNFCHNLLSDIEHPQEICPLELAKKSKKREIRIFKSGDKFLECIVDPILDENNNITGTVHILSDITSIKKSEEDIKENLSRIKKTFEQTIRAFSQLVEVRDPYTSGHQKKVSEIAVSIAKDLGLSVGTIESIRLASLIHDIGKISIPASILSKPGELTDIERAMIETHPVTGYDIVKEIDFPYPIAKIILQHHEKINGSGYPGGLKGDNIMLEAKIIAVSDVIEAISSHRPYREARTLRESFDEISNNKGIFYDPDVVDSCIKIFFSRKPRELKRKVKSGIKE